MNTEDIKDEEVKNTPEVEETAAEATVEGREIGRASCRERV